MGPPPAVLNPYSALQSQPHSAYESILLPGSARARREGFQRTQHSTHRMPIPALLPKGFLLQSKQGTAPTDLPHTVMAPTAALLGAATSSGVASRPAQRSLAVQPCRAPNRTYNLGSRYGLRVSAIAAPEKPSTNSSEPFTAWGTAVQRVPKRDDLKTIMVLGAGPIIIGQAS
jgi:hypothetical protein